MFFNCFVITGDIAQNPGITFLFLYISDQIPEMINFLQLQNQPKF